MADYVNLKDQRRMRVLVPNASTMKSFADAADPLFAEADSLRAANDRLAATRDLLLPRLVTGKLDISEIDLGALTPPEAA
jgi:type I restriction enzyme S subunit